MKAKLFLMITILSLMRIAAAQPASDPSLKRVESSEQAAMAYLIQAVQPKYPAGAKISGKVILKIVIDKEGHVSEVKLVSGHPMLVGAAIDAVKQWKFYPYNIFDDGVAEVETTATVEFYVDPPHVVAPQPMPPLRLRIASGVAEGLILRRPTPVYPPEAKTKHIQGNVILNVLVDTQGNVISAKVISGDPLLVEAAMTSAKQWKYKPYTLSGEPVGFETSIKIHFHL